MRTGNCTTSRRPQKINAGNNTKASACKNRRKRSASAGLFFVGTRPPFAAALVIISLLALALPVNADYTERNVNNIAETAYEMTAAYHRIYFPDHLDSSVRLLSQGWSCEFTQGDMSYSAGEDYLGSPRPALAKFGDQTVLYPDVFEHVDIEYHLTDRGIKEFYVLTEKPRAPAGHLFEPTLDFTQTIDTGGLSMYVDGATAPDEFTTNRSIEFVDETSGDTIFTLPAPYAVDAAGDILPIRYTVQTRGNTIRIHTRTPYAWLDDPARVYPVKIDPSATLTADYSVVLEGGTTWDTSWIGSGHFDHAQRTGIDFDTSTIPDTATITKVELKINIDDEYGPVGNDVASMTKKAYTYHVTDNDKTGFNTDVDGNDYLSNSSGFEGTGYHTVELLSAAATDLQSQLGADWFSVGWTGTTEADKKGRDGHTHSEANPPQLIVTYTDPSAPDSITASPGTVAMVYDATLCGNLDKDWKNLTNATASNNSYADFSDKNFDSGEISKRLDLTNFGFAVPDGATIDGVKVEIERYASSGDAQDEVVHLMLAGSPDTTENKALTSTAWPTSDPNSYQSYGGTTDKWGIASLSESDVENSGFGATLCVEATSNDTDADVDHVQITVYYSTGTPLTGVSNSPSPNTVSDTSTHTVAFTTADALPADGKIVVTFPAGFDLTAVGNTDISSGTMDGSFTVSRSGQELTITRSGGSSQAAAAENIIIADITNTGTAGTSYTVDVETQDSGGSAINGPTTSSTFTIKGKSALADPATQVADQLSQNGGSQPTDVELVGFKITPTGENLTWTDLVISLTYGGGMADADITNAQIYVDNGTVGTYESGTDTQVGAQSVNASGGSLTWNAVGGTITAATNYLVIFDAGASLTAGETVQATITAANITVTGATTSASITSSGVVTNEPQHTVTAAPESITQSPGTVSMVYDDTLCGNLDKDWKNLTNATASNNSYADFSDKNFDSGEISKRLDLTNFGFTVPDGATINGVKVEIERYASAGGAQDEVVHLLLAGSPDTTENKALTSTAWPTSDPNSYQSYGGTTDNWGIGSLAESDVENSGFGATLCVEATSNDTDADVDHVQITVYYSTTTPLTGVSNSPSPNTVSDTSTHTVAFTTVDALPADGKIVVTFPAGFDLTAVGNADISSGTMDGSFTVSASGQVLTITRSGGSSQSAAAENIIIADITNTSTVGTSYTVDVETRNAGGTTINGPTTSSAFTIKGKSVLANSATQVADQLGQAEGTQPTDVELVGFKITPTGENLTWTNLVVSLTYGGGMADADITNAEIYVDNGTVGTYESGTDTQVGAQSVNASGGSLTWNTVGGTISAATNYLIIFDAGASLSANETVQASVTAANITVSGATSSQSITTSGAVTDEPLHTVTVCGTGQFSYRRSLVIDYTKVGADNSGTLPSTGFPVLVSLSGDWLKTTTADPVNGRIANANGWDIVFRESDERTGLYHEIEEYDGTNGTLVAWVRIDSLSKSADTTFYIYYGNACLTVDPADADNVWDSSFEGVWHLVEEQSGTGSNDLYTDSTSNNYHGDDQISATGQEGKIADGQQFDGSNDYINLDGQGIEDHDYDAFTIEMWYKSSISLVTDDQYIYTHMDSTWSDYVTVGPTDDGTDDDKVRVSIGDGGTAGNVYGTTDVVDQQWHHLAMVRTGGGAGSRIKIYVDGNEETDAADPSGGGLIAMATTDDGPYIGDDPGNTEQVNGFLDEVRVSSIERDADWIKTSFNNQDNATPGAGNFIKSLGSEATAFSTAIDLLSLSATGSGSAVQVDWVTGSETGNLGFYLYRATSPYGPFVRITDQLIAGLNHSVESRAYSYTDANVTPGETYYYKLEDLDMDGRRTFHGPVGVNWDGAGAPEVTEGDPEPAPWEPGGAAGPVTVSATNEPVYKILVAGEGLYRLSRDFLTGQGVALDKVDLSRVRLYHLGREVAIWVHDANGDTVFDAADHITFYALPVAAEFAKYSTDNVYWLTTGAGENTVKRMAAVDSAPDDSALATGFDATVRNEQDQYYYPNAPGADELDRWLNSTWVVGAEISWPGAGSPITFNLDTPGATGTGTLTVALLGTYDTDHQVDISVNGGAVQTFTWSGIAFYEAVIADAALVDGLNAISLTCQTGLDALLVDWLTADYPRNYAADGDEIKFTSDSPERFLVTDFAGAELLAFDITDPENVSRSVNSQTTGSGPYSLEFTPPNGAAEARTYLALSSDALLIPQAVAADVASNLTDAASGADYILITHRNLGWNGSGDPYAWLTDLLAHRQAQGHRVLAVDLTDVYDEFSFGLATPAAIKDFLAYAVSFWTAPAPQHVLLVGDATYDYKDNWGNGAAADVPSYTIYTREAGETVTDEWYAAISGGDALPDLYIGRLPAATAAEAQVMAAKIISYESAVNTKTWQKNILLVADDRSQDEEAVFETMNDNAAGILPDALQPPFKAYLADYGSADALNADLKARIDAGSLLLNYSGHASVQIWAQENVFDNNDVSGLVNDAGRYPFIVNMSCLSGYFAYPAAWNFPSLSEALLRAENKGAVGMLVPSGQTNPKHQLPLNEALFEAVFDDDIRQVGAAIGRAKQALLQNNPNYTEVSQTFLLLGDPAMVLQVPLPRRPAGLTAQLTTGSTVDLAWNSALDANGGAVAGYNIYRSAGVSGPWTQLNGTALVDTVYSDDGLATGAAYYYVVTALDTDGDESVFSDTASVVLTDSDGDRLYDLLEAAGCTDVNLSDSDGDGLSDGAEDANGNGTVDAGETDPCDADSDADSLPDGWETAYGLNALSGTGDDGADGDADGDGWTSYQEYQSCTDPLDAGSVPTAPGVPALNYPANGSETTTLEPWLSVSNAADADCQDVRYIFELYADAALTTLVEATAAEGMAEGGNTTAWQPGSALNENAHYYWRARAYDSLASSDWMATARFIVNSTPEAPTIPVVSAPPDGSEVTLHRPTLEVVNASDADGDPLTYAFEVYADENLDILVDSQTTVAEGGSATTAWQVAVELDDNTDYWWTVKATDDENLTGGWSAAARFFVNTSNDAPTTPPGGSPADGAEVATTTPLLAVVHATDADLDALSYYFEIDTVATFDSFELEQSGALAEQAGVSTSWTPLELIDNTTYHWRVRAFDGAAYSPWQNGLFFVNTANDAPGAPTVDHPGDASEITTRQPTLSVKVAVDADLDTLVYEFELYEDAEMAALVTDAADAGQNWQVDQTLADNRSYFWRARAVDAHGAEGPWSTLVSFFINTANDTPGTPVLNNPVSGGIATSLTPTLSVFNVDDPDQDDLTYAFELYADADLSQLVHTAVVAEGHLITSWTVSNELDDHGVYYWRARADDGQQPGSWMPTAVFEIHTAGTETAHEIVTRQPVSAAATAHQTVNVSAVDSPIHNTVVELPPGALPRDCSINIGPVTNPPALPHGTRKIGTVTEFGPSGMTFNVPVVIRLPYTAAALNQARVANPVELTVYWYDPSILTWVPVEIESIDTVNQLIDIKTDHFSMYTVGAAVADASGGGGGGSCFIAAVHRAETVFYIADWSDISICVLLALAGFLWLGGRRKRR